MQKEHKNIDELFKSELSGFKTAAPTFVKTQLAKKLFSAKKLFFFSASIVALVSASTFLLLAPKNQDLTLSDNLTEPTITIENKLNSTEIQTEKLSTNEIADNIYQEENETSIDNLNKIDLNTTTEESTIKTKTSNNSVQNSQTPSTLPKSSVKKDDSATLPTKNKDSNITKDQTIKTNTEVLNSNLPNNTTTVKQTDNTIENNKPKTTEVVHNENAVQSTSDDNVLESQNSSTPSQSSVKKDATANSSTKNKDSNITKNQTIKSNTEILNPDLPNNTTTIKQTENTVENNKLKPTETTNVKEPTSEVIPTEEIVETDSTSADNINNSISQKDFDNTPQPKNISYLFSLTSGFNLSKPTYSSTDGTDDASYYQTYNSENINVEHNLSANVLVKDNFLIGSGIGISKQSYDYAYNEISFITSTTVDTFTLVNVIYDPSDVLEQFPLDTIYETVYDTVTWIDDISTTPFNGKSYGKYVHIPLQLGYVFNVNKFMFGIQANLRYNILYSAAGQFYNNNTVSTFDKSNSIFRKSYFDFALKADVYYNIFDKFYLNGSFKYSPQINNTYQNLTIERKLKYLHFGVGLSYKL